MELEGWEGYRKLVIEALTRLDDATKDLRNLIDKLKDDNRSETNKLREDLRKDIENERAARVRLEIEFAMQKVRVSLLAAGSAAVVSALLSWVMRTLLK